MSNESDALAEARQTLKAAWNAAGVSWDEVARFLDRTYDPAARAEGGAEQLQRDARLAEDWTPLSPHASPAQAIWAQLSPSSGTNQTKKGDEG